MDESIARKLAVPKKLTTWEREKQAAEVKKQRQEAENAAALRDFEKSLGAEDDVDFPPALRRDRGPPSGPRADRFESAPTLKRKRALDEAKEQHRHWDDGDINRLKHDRSRETPQTQEPGPEVDLPKPVIHLQSIPPGATIEEIKALMSPRLKVHSARFSDRRRGARDRSLAAVVTLTSDTNLKQIEDAISGLKDKYLGRGYKLIVSRYDETAFEINNGNGKRSAGPFGASTVDTSHEHFSTRNAPPPKDYGHGRGRYEERRGVYRSDAEVKVNLPLDICTVRAVHTIADRLLSETDADKAMELETLLMNMPEVQADEKFSFLYDSSSSAGIYYRYCLWTREMSDTARASTSGPERIHDDSRTLWDISTQGTTFPNLTSLSQIVTDIDYASSEDESDNEDVHRRQPGRPEPENLLVETERNFLLPLQHARLTHLLARLPTASTRLRKGDVARVTNFAINHAGSGAEQIVDKLLLNVHRPFATTSAASYDEAGETAYEQSSDESDYDPEAVSGPVDGDDGAADLGNRNDNSGAKLVALYVISDVLSASATAGARNSWKYRQLFEAGFQRLETFEKLSVIDKDLGWGRMKMEQWKRKISAIFDIWEGWSVFSADTMQTFRRIFNKQSLPDESNTGLVETEAGKQKPRWMTRIKVIDKDVATDVRRGQTGEGEDRQASAQVETVKDAAPDADPNLASNGHTSQNLSPETYKAASVQEAQKTVEDVQQPSSMAKQAEGTSVMPPSISKEQTTMPAVTKKRMRAEDMFADSDEDAF